MSKTSVVWATAFAVSVIAAIATAQHRFRYHDETSAEPLRLVPATVDPGENSASVRETGSKIKVTGNGIPDHLVGQFPNSGNPHQIETQKVRLRLTAPP
ncbi:MULTISPECIES: hypothetical protein [unclassified Ruegeria]|uniref:hypothetical protein n=1 Tax=unclassified Ruegeria TaxID=2625375 RepID=UPI001487F50D|nr:MULTISPECIES: hypothetical protein [unclassified Ruegeria]NOD36871.1 hypothetical protein [Ruegeria sp. HKCCD7296]NOD47145.1 hypothetical protein [Ruegeria sp. HKCCD5849]NOD51468.1 hypothetical protein [Ruegeria sp. HKCCD5851]NOD69387.1 hypothetical protein [Ruegeria sp. HKCCD7303]NOE36003.1 hypothetical protein [Ruegeria sp. HKCCD7318]